MTRFAVLVLCPGASYSDLLMESRSRDVTVLEMIPYSTDKNDYERYLHSPYPTPILFVLRAGQSMLVERPEDIPEALHRCCAAEDLSEEPTL